MTTERTGPLEPFVYNGQSRDQIPEDVEHLIVDSSVEEIPPIAFRWIGSLAKVEIKSGVQTIGRMAFFECNNLAEVVIPSTVVEIGEMAFFQCKDLQKVVLPMGLTQIGDLAFGSCYTLTEIIIPSTVVEIGHCAFSDCSSLSNTIDLPMGLQRIGQAAFENCHNLVKISIPSTVTEFGWKAFYECGNLQSIDIKGGDNLPLAIRLSTQYPTKTPNITMSFLVSQYFFHRITALDLLEPGCYGDQKQQCMENEGKKLEEIKSAFVEHLRLLVDWRVCSGNFTNQKRKGED